MTRPTWQECAAAGMSATEAAAARGVTVSAAVHAARRNGLQFRDTREEQAKAHAERMRKRHADPEFAKAHAERAAERMRKRHADPEFNPLVLLAPQEREHYDTLKRAGYTRAEAFEAIGRRDLLEAAE